MSASQTRLGKFQMPRVGDTLEGRYEIRQVLASGGMGVILKAKHLRMGREVAVKVLHPHIAQEQSVVARFEREVRLAQTLNHPNTIRLYDFGEAENGLIYVVMELLEGKDLKEIIADEGTLPMGRVVDLSLQLLDGLGEAHEQDFVHRDLKPSNLFVAKNRRGHDLVKILDFGIAKSLEDAGADLTATGSICGTAAYVAPEYLHSGDPHKQADIYAVGLIILEMLTGRRAFRGSTTAQTLVMQMQRRVRIPPQIAATPLGAIIERAVQKDPARRYADADQMYAALEAVAADLPADLRLVAHQVGELLAPPSGTIQPRPGPFTDANTRESSSSLPQAHVTPATGDHPEPAPPAGDAAGQEFGFDQDPTLVTPLPADVDRSHQFEARPAPAPAAPGLGGAPRSTKNKVNKNKGNKHKDNKNRNRLWAVIAGLVVLAGALAAVLVSGPGGETAGVEPGEEAASVEDIDHEQTGLEQTGPEQTGPEQTAQRSLKLSPMSRARVSPRCASFASRASLRARASSTATSASARPRSSTASRRIDCPTRSSWSWTASSRGASSSPATPKASNTLPWSRNKPPSPRLLRSPRPPASRNAPSRRRL